MIFWMFLLFNSEQYFHWLPFESYENLHKLNNILNVFMEPWIIKCEGVFTRNEIQSVTEIRANIILY